MPISVFTKTYYSYTLSHPKRPNVLQRSCDNYTCELSWILTCVLSEKGLSPGLYTDGPFVEQIM